MRKDMAALRLPNRIAWKLIKALIAFSSILTIGTTALQLWSEYGRDINAIDTHFRQVERGYLQSVAENVWEADTERLNLLVQGIVEFTDFKSAVVRDENGVELARSGRAQGTRLMRKVYPLFYTFRGKRRVIGELDVAASLSSVYARALDRVGLILVANFVKTFLVALFFFAVVYYLLTRHLHVMARFARNLDFINGAGDLFLERGRFAGEADELDALAAALNEMKAKLFLSYDELHALSGELEGRVRERTRELSTEIEARKRTAKKLEESESRLRDIIEAGSDWIWEMGPDFCFSYISGGILSAGVNDGKSMPCHTLEDFSANDDERKKWRLHMDDLENHRSFRDFEYPIRQENGTRLYVCISGKPTFDEKGNFLGYRGTGSDITARIEAELQVARAQEQLRVLSSALEQSPSAVFITDHLGVIEYVNTKFTTLTGYTRKEIVGKNPRILRAAGAAYPDDEDLWRHINQGREWRGEIKDKRKDGITFWADVTVAPVKDNSGKITHFIVTHEDITERKAAAKRLRGATELAEIANRAKSELMANMSHELRTPLNAIIGFSDTMLNHVFGPIGNKRYEEYVGDIHDSGAHLLDLINDILDVSAIEAGKLELRCEPLDVEALVQACLKLVNYRAEEGALLLDYRIEKNMPQFYADERRIKQVLLNLLTNAVKFTPEGGRVTLSALLAADGSVRFEVEDTGIGMDEAGIKIAMAQFGQVDSKLARKYEGTGLGLPLSKHLVEAHGGTLEIHSHLGRGAVVSVKFPPERSLAPGESHGADAGNAPAAEG